MMARKKDFSGTVDGLFFGGILPGQTQPGENARAKNTTGREPLKTKARRTADGSEKQKNDTPNTQPAGAHSPADPAGIRAHIHTRGGRRSQRVQLVTTPELWQELTQEAERLNTSRNDLINALIIDYLTTQKARETRTDGKN